MVAVKRTFVACINQQDSASLVVGNGMEFSHLSQIVDKYSHQMLLTFVTALKWSALQNRLTLSFRRHSIIG